MAYTETERQWRKANRTSIRVSERRWELKNPWQMILKSARARAKKLGVPFALTAADLGAYPSHCPVLGIPLSPGNRPYCASIDRIDNDKGYTPDNVIVISFLANRIKNNSTPEQLQQVAAFYAALQGAIQ